MILIIDHRDSFTRNLEHLLAEFGKVEVIDRLKAREKCREAQMLVLSPGPGRPTDYPETIKLYEEWRGEKPILGICLGFQLMLQAEGAQIIRQEQVLHGVETEIETTCKSITYEGIEPPIKVGRYHSLQACADSPKNLPNSIRITAIDRIRNVPLSFEDCDRKLFGLQYHPESFLTNHGHAIAANVVRACLGSD